MQRRFVSGIVSACRVQRNSAVRAFSTPAFSGENLPSDEAMQPFYALGVNVAQQTTGSLKSLMSEEELKALVMGYQDSLLDKIEKPEAMLAHFGPGIQTMMGARADAQVNATIKEGELFAAEYVAANPDAAVLESGLVFHETEVGAGAQPSDNCSVKAHYTGKFVNGKVFDSSYERGEPIEFPIDKVIDGWTQGLKMMKEGSKATLVIPHTIGYGEKGQPPVIPPVTTLVFDVHLIAVVENKD